MIGELMWFDVSSGEGEVQVDNKVLYLHFTSIAGIGANNYEWPTESDQVLLGNLKSGDLCKLKLYTNLDQTQIELAEFDLITHE